MSPCDTFEQVMMYGFLSLLTGWADWGACLAYPEEVLAQQHVLCP